MVCLQSGKSGGNPDHGAANAYKNDDNDSITTLHNTLANLTYASNANTNELNKKISSMAHEMTPLRTTVGQKAQQLANITTTPTVCNPAWSAPPTWAESLPVPTNIYLNPGATNPYTPPPDRKLCTNNPHTGHSRYPPSIKYRRRMWARWKVWRERTWRVTIQQNPIRIWT